MTGQAKKPLVLVACPIQVFPVAAGGVSRMWAYVGHLREAGFRVELVTVPLKASDAREAGKRLDRLWIAQRQPLPKSAPKPRLARRISNALPPAARSILRPLFFQVRSLRQKLRTTSNGRRVSSLDRLRDPHFEAYAAKIARELNPIAVITTFVWTARMLDHLPPGTLKLLDTQDIQHQRASIAEAAGYDLSRTFCTREEEIQELNRADVLLCIQDEELREFQKMCPQREPLLLEHAVPVPKEPVPPPPDSLKLLFVGNLYEPNVIGINAFIEQAWPAIRQAVPGATLQVCGRVCRQVRRNLEGVLLEGVVPSLDPYYAEAAVVIVPVPFGTGLKIKTVEAMAAGKAIVSTAPGVVGLPKDSGRLYEISNIQDMARPVIELLIDPGRREILGRNAHEFALQRFAPASAFRQLEDRLRRHATIHFPPHA